jgi:hypothetical protein
MRSFLACLVVSGAVIGCRCDGLPEDFADLSVNEKVREYSAAVERCDRGSRVARHSISEHGLEAAEAVYPFLNIGDERLPLFEGVMIVNDVCASGVNLKGTRIESRLRELSKSPGMDETTRFAVRSTLALIDNECGLDAPVDANG